MPTTPNEPNEPNDGHHLDRRQALRSMGATAAAAGALAWAAPAIVTVEAAAAATAATGGTVSGLISSCQPQNPPPSDFVFDLACTPSGGGATQTFSSSPGGGFSFGLPAGSWDIVITLTAPFSGGPESFPGIIVTDGATTFFNPVYTIVC